METPEERAATLTSGPVITLDPVAPIGTRTASGFVDRADGTGGFESWEANVYPPHPEGEKFREWRKAMGFSLRDVASRLRAKPSDVSDLEFGRTVPREGWDALYKFLGQGKDPRR